MKLDMIRKNLGWLMKIQPPAIHLDQLGRELPYRDEEWVLSQISADGESLTLQEARVNGLATKLGKDVVHHFDTDKNRGDRHGLLLLGQQMFIKGNTISYRPCAVHGQRVDPLPPLAPVRIPVDFDFIRTSGIQQRLEAAGFEVNGVVEQRLAKLELEGWEPIIENDRYGKPTQYYLQDPRPGMSLIFIKKRKPTTQHHVLPVNARRR
jgi:hypothetical protein